MSDWIEWHGGQCPLPAGTQFEYRLRNGGTGEPLWNPTAWNWGHDGGEYDIVAYRSLSPPEIDREASLYGGHAALWHSNYGPTGGR